MRRGDEVVGQRAAHVLVDPGVVGVDHVVLPGQHVHGETVLGHEEVLLSCKKQEQCFHRPLVFRQLHQQNCRGFN